MDTHKPTEQYTKNGEHIAHLLIWDRQDERFVKPKYYHYDEEHKREYFKGEGHNLWLENGVALDVFTTGKKGELIPYARSSTLKEVLEIIDEWYNQKWEETKYAPRIGNMEILELKTKITALGGK